MPASSSFEATTVGLSVIPQEVPANGISMIRCKRQNGYGSMQVHNIKARQTVLPTIAEKERQRRLGIGNSKPVSRKRINQEYSGLDIQCKRRAI